MVTTPYSHNHLISLVMLDRQSQPLMHTDVRRREIWEWSDHTPSLPPVTDLPQQEPRRQPFPAKAYAIENK